MTEELAGSVWPGDEGELHYDSRRALVQLIKGPYVSEADMPDIWKALVADQRLIRSRLNDLFLDLEIDKSDGFAFAKGVEVQDVTIPKTLRTKRLRFLDTAMLLVLRQHLLAAPRERDVFVDKDEVIEALEPYRQTDKPAFKRNANGAWSRMVDHYRVLHVVPGSDRARVSPIVRFLINADSAEQLTAVYQKIADGNEADPEPDADSPDEGGDEARE